MKRSGRFCLSSEPCLPGTLSFDRAGLRRKLAIQLQSHTSGFCYRPTGVVNNSGLARVYSGHKPSFDLLTQICLRQRTQSGKNKNRSSREVGIESAQPHHFFFCVCVCLGATTTTKNSGSGTESSALTGKKEFFFFFSWHCPSVFRGYNVTNHGRD